MPIRRKLKSGAKGKAQPKRGGAWWSRAPAPVVEQPLTWWERIFGRRAAPVVVQPEPSSAGGWVAALLILITLAVLIFVIVVLVRSVKSTTPVATHPQTVHDEQHSSNNKSWW